MSANIGVIFEATIAKSWVASGINLVRMKITETGEEKPCDERIDFENFRVFNELKSTEAKKFSAKMLKRHQIVSLYNWHYKFNDSIGLVTIEMRSYSIAFIIDIQTLVNHCKSTNFVCIDDFSKLHCYRLELTNGLYHIDDDFMTYLKEVMDNKHDNIGIKRKFSASGTVDTKSSKSSKKRV